MTKEELILSIINFCHPNDCPQNRDVYTRFIHEKLAEYEAEYGPSLQLVAAERRRHIEVKGWTAEHDDQHPENRLTYAAACYGTAGEPYDENDLPSNWPFDRCWWKPTPDDCMRELTKAAALIVAEMDRLRRANEQWRKAVMPDDWNKPVRFKRDIEIWQSGVLCGAEDETYLVSKTGKLSGIVFARFCEVQG